MSHGLKDVHVIHYCFLAYMCGPTYCCQGPPRSSSLSACAKPRQRAPWSRIHGRYRSHSFEGFSQTDNIFSRQSSTFVSVWSLSKHLDAGQQMAFQPKKGGHSQWPYLLSNSESLKKFINQNNKKVTLENMLKSFEYCL